jgi:hypothetical protein
MQLKDNAAPEYSATSKGICTDKMTHGHVTIDNRDFALNLSAVVACDGQNTYGGIWSLHIKELSNTPSAGEAFHCNVKESLKPPVYVDGRIIFVMQCQEHKDCTYLRIAT